MVIMGRTVLCGMPHNWGEQSVARYIFADGLNLTEKRKKSKNNGASSPLQILCSLNSGRF